MSLEGGTMRHSLRCAIIAPTILLFLVPGLVHAQATGEIRGLVTDPTGAVVPGVRVTATQTATGVSQSTNASSAGTYTIPQLLVGTYRITAVAAGFKTAVADQITLNVSQQREVDFTLALAGVRTTVKVSAAPPLLNTTNGTLSNVVSAEQVQNLPLNGRDITGLIFMQPGVVAPSGGNPGWVSNGNRAETAVGTLDSADISDAEMGYLEFTNFNLESISEFKVLQGNYSAQYGQGGGTITQMVSKSGTNQFHGSAYEFLRNSAFDARNFFATSVSPLERSEFGVTFGGPIRRNKTFFYGEYAGLRQEAGGPNLVAVPTADERNGTVSIPDPNNPAQTDVLQVPLNPVAQSILSKYPMPNQPSGVFGANTFYFLFKSPTSNNQFSARLDQHFSDKDSLFARASWGNNVAEETDAWAAVLGGANFSQSSVYNLRNYSVSETHIFSPTKLNTFMFTLNRGIDGYPEVPAEATTTGTIFDDGSLQGWGPDPFLTQYNVNVFDPKDDFVWTTARHSLHFGAEFRREQDNGTGVTSVGPGGQFDFDAGTPLPVTIPSTNGGSSLVAGTPSPNGVISMMEGAAVDYARSTTVPGYGPPGGGVVWWGLRRWAFGGYVQDDIKVARKLTLNLGLRYEYASVPWEVGNRFAVPADSGSLYGDFVVNPQPLWPPDYISGDFAPRFGFAAQFTKNTVLRGGFGTFTNMIPTVYPDQALVNFPVASLNYLSNPVYSLTPLPVSLPVLTSTSGQPVAANGNSKTVPANTPVNLASYAAILGPLTGDYPSDRLRNGYTISDNFTLEHEFPGGISAQASYVGSIGISLYNSEYPNAFDNAEPQYTPYADITPGLGEIEMIYNGGHSDYNALQLQARKISAEHGLQFQANYTYAKTLTDVDDVWQAAEEGGGVTQNNPQCIKCEYGRAGYSIAQVFNANFEYDLPVVQWQAFSHVPERLTHGWKMLGIFTAQSGSPFTVVGPYGTLQYGFDDWNGVGARPFLLKQPTLNPGGGTQFFSNAVIGNNDGLGDGFFGLPTVTSPVDGSAVLPTPGNLGRNTFTGPGWWNLDFSVIKDTKITESKTLQFRAEFFNVFNAVTFGYPGNYLGSQNFGISTGTATAEREIQFGLRFMF
jgi:Carboxypeptidase regulatory-like domain/TonB dependent receptor